MDNLLHCLGPTCRGYRSGDASTLVSSSGEAGDEAQAVVHKSRSLTRPRPKPVEVKERPSSCCYEKEQRAGDFEIVRNEEGGPQRKMNPPQPPTRKDSFRATRGRSNVANKRCTSAPVEISSVSSSCTENKSSLNVESGIHNGFPTPEDKTGNFKDDILDAHYIQRQSKDIRHLTCDISAKTEHILETTSDHLSDEVTSLVSITSCQPGSISAEVQGQSHMHSKTKHSSMSLHRHSAPEKLLATQLQLLQFDNDSTSQEPCNPLNSPGPSLSPCSSQHSHSSLQLARECQEASQDLLHAPSNKWGGSRCSTPGSVFLEGDGDDAHSSEKLQGMGVNGGSLSPVQHHHNWGRSVSVPGDPSGSSTQGRLRSEQILDREFEPLSSTASMDTLLEEQRSVDSVISGGKKEEDVRESTVKNSNASRNHRRNRRRSERFATNLRNEIQRKKAQLQSSRGPGGLLCSGETVQEEEGPDLYEEGADPDLPPQNRHTRVAFATPACAQDVRTTALVEKSRDTSSELNHSVMQIQSQSTAYTQNNNPSRSVRILDPRVPSFGVGIRVVEEPAPAGKARRWRWTPEHKLQPEPEPDRRCRALSERGLGVTGSQHGVCAFTSSSTSSYSRSSSCSRKEESDILPFADRMKFFEQTSRGMSGSNISSPSSHRQKKPPNHPEQGGEPVLYPTQRRYSYQGGIQQENSLFLNTGEARRQSVSTSRERQKEKEREQTREREEWEERLRERTTEERERQKEKERQERELEIERARLREIERGREQEEQVRQWEMERERDLELDREKEMEMAREKERLKNMREKELEREREKEREEDTQLISHQEFYSNSGTKDRHHDFQHKDNLHNFQPKLQVFSHSQAHNQVPRSAFHPVSMASRFPENQQPSQQGYTVRSYTPTEVRLLLLKNNLTRTLSRSLLSRDLDYKIDLQIYSLKRQTVKCDLKE